MTNIDKQDIEITTEPSNLTVDHRQQRESDRVASKFASFGFSSLKVLDLTSGTTTQGALDARSLSSGFTRSRIPHEFITDLSGVTHTDIVVCLVGSRRTAPLAELINAKPAEIVLALQAFDVNDQTRWVDLVSANAELLVLRGYSRDLSFNSVRGAAYLARYMYSGTAPSPETLVAYEVALAKSEFTSLDLSGNSTQTTTDSEVLALKHALAVAEEKAANAVQAAYVAQDALAGANAEKSRAVGVAADYQYKAFVQHDEILTMVDELDKIKKQSKARRDYISFKTRLRRTPFGALLAKVTAPIRHRS